MAGVVGRRRGRSTPTVGRRAVPVPAPRHALGGRASGRPRGRGARRRRRRRDRELRARRVRRAAAWLDAHPGPRRVLDHPVRPHRSVRRAPDDRVHRAGRGGRSRRARLGPARCRSRPAGAPASGWRARSRRWRSRRPRGARDATGHGDHIDFSIAEVMTIAASSYAEYIRALRRAARRSHGATRTIETPSIEPTLDGYVGFCTNSRAAVPQLPAAHRPSRPHRRAIAWSARPTGKKRWDEWNEIVHAWTPQHTTAEIVRRASELRIPVAPVHGGENILECDQFVARNVFVDDATGHVQDAAPPVAHGRRGPAAAAPGAAPGRAHRRDRAAHAGAAPSTGAPPSCRWRGAGARPHRVVGRSHRRRRARRARRRRDPRRVGQPHRRHAQHRRHDGHGGRVVGTERALPLLEHQQARPHPRPRDRPTGWRCCAELIARERRGARELLAARARATSGSTGSRSTRSTRAASSCACPRSGCRGRGATTSGSRRRWSR